MSSLKEYKFDKLYKMSSGISSKPEQAGHGSPFVSFSTVFNNAFLPSELVDSMDTSELEQETYSIKKGDIFLTRTSETINELGMSCVAINDYPKATYSGFVKRLRPTQTTITYDKYMGFYLRSRFFRKTMTNNAVMTLRASFNEEIFSYLKLFLPEFKTQKIVGDFLFLLNTKIELNNHINADLSSIAKILFDYWFVQFDFPNKNGKPYKSSGGEMIWNAKLKREIPVGWGVENLKENSLSELICPGINQFEGQKIYLPTADVENNIINFNANKITYEKRESRANMQPVANSVWFAKMKNSKKVLYFGDYSEEYLNNLILSTGFAGLKCKEYALEFLWNFIDNRNFEFIKDRLANGATQESINNDSMAFVPIVVPLKDLIQSYHGKTQSIYKLIYNNQVENKNLSELRDWLLPMLMNGQVKVN